jgi:uncharacterized RDD family membrane protein YckC
MSNIEIQTSQNVAIEYEAAPLRDRIIGCLLDMLILAVGGGFISMAIYSATGSGTLAYCFIVPVVVFYSLTLEVFNNGKSLGKMMLGTQVVRLDGQETRLNDFLIRWAFRSVDILLSMGSLATIMVTITKRHQRLGDFVANTVVIKTKASYFITLESVLKKKSAEGYVPVYPDVTRFSEEQMLVLKNTIDRSVSYPNDAHKEAIILLSKQVAAKMNIAVPQKKLEFLKQVLKDYVILTR